jgi:hypothetical protein
MKLMKKGTMKVLILPKFKVKPYPKERTTVGNDYEEYVINTEKRMLFVNLTKDTSKIMANIETQGALPN